jgi:hypothetical protein
MIRVTLTSRLVRASLALGTAMSLAPLTAPQSQESLPIAPGTRVRVASPKLVAPLVANFLRMRGDTAVFMEDGSGRGVWSIQLADITRLERSSGERRGERGNMLKGAAIGGGAGLVLGYGFAATFSPSDSSKKFSRALTGLVGAAVGGTIGALIGYRRGVENWTNVTLPRRLSVIPYRRGAGLSFTFEF